MSSPGFTFILAFTIGDVVYKVTWWYDQNEPHFQFNGLHPAVEDNPFSPVLKQAKTFSAIPVLYTTTDWTTEELVFEYYSYNTRV